MKKIRSQHAQALIVVALALAGLMAMVALVVDGGNAFLDKRKAQNAADSAALAAALARIRSGQDIASAAMESAATNGYNNDGENNVVLVYSPPQSGPHAGQIEYIQVIITSRVKTYFARVIGRDTITNVVTAVSRTKTSEMTQLMNGMAIISLAPSSNCNAQKAFWLHGSTTLDISGGGIFVNSDSSCAFMQNGNGSVRLSNGAAVNVVGGATIDKPLLITPGVVVGAVPVNYPPPFFLPDVSCTADAEVSSDGASMTAGRWAEEFPPAGVMYLGSGVYCLENGIDIKDNIQGINVVFKVEKGDIRFNGNSRINFDAPNTGDNAGLLIYVPLENKSKITINGGAGSSINGTILAPASHILIKGMDENNAIQSQIIGYTFEADTPNTVKIIYNDAQNYNALTMPEVQLTE